MYPPAPLVAEIGDGVTDDHTTLTSIASYCNLNGFSMFLHPNTYKVNAKLTIKCSLIGAGEDDVLIDFSDNPDDECLYFNQFKIIAERFRVKCNADQANQFAMSVFYCSDASSFRDIIFEDDTPNGLKVSKLWYANFRNIRMRSIKNAGAGIKIINHAEGGVNGVHFDSIYIQGVNNSVIFEGTGLASEALQFTTCTFENGFRTPVKITSNAVRNVKMQTCYFEGVYSNATDTAVPVLLDSSITTYL